MGWTDLTRYLASSDERFVLLSFEQIERIMDMKLPNSARDHRPFWANSHRNNYAKHWMDAGYTVSTRGVPTGRIRFEKTRAARS